MMSVQQASLNSLYHAVLLASLITILAMYIQLRLSYSNLYLSCTPQNHMNLPCEPLSACAIACSDLCSQQTSTDFEEIYEFSMFSSPLSRRSESQAATEDAVASVIEKSKTPQNILPSNPVAFQTSDRPSTQENQYFLKSHFSVPLPSSQETPKHNPEMTLTLGTLSNENIVHESFTHSQGDSFSVGDILPSSSDWQKSMFTDSATKFEVTGESTKHTFQQFTYSDAVLDTVPQTSVNMIVSSSLGSTELPQIQTLSPTTLSDIQTDVQSLDKEEHYEPHSPTMLVGAENNYVIFTDEIDIYSDYCNYEGCDHNTQIGDLTDNYSESLDTVVIDSHEIGDCSTQQDEMSKVAGSEILQKMKLHGTVGICDEMNDSTESCHFNNLCYNTITGDFVFLIGENSKLEIRSAHNNFENNYLLQLNLSAVQNHNAHTYPVAFIPTSSLETFKVAIIEGSSFIMSRFKPDNIMHTLHDDLFPLIHTLSKLDLLYQDTQPYSHIKLVFADLFDPCDNAPLYSLVSSDSNIISLIKSNSSSDLVCFDEAFTGLSQSTIWYQYGFFIPQGPLKVDESQVLHNVRTATEYLLNALYSPCLFCTRDKYLVLLSRKDNRLILNEGDLIMSLVRSTKLKVISVSLETHTVGEIISIVRDSRGTIGMHGSLQIFGVFLRPGSIFIELFPYAVTPEKYTPFKTFCAMPSSGLVYRTWSNPDLEKTVGYPERAPDQGGIYHLPNEVQESIIAQTEVPDHLCCEDPSWLYHIYQDTEVSVSDIVSLVTNALAEANSYQVGGDHKHPLSSFEVEDQFLTTSGNGFASLLNVNPSEVGSRKSGDNTHTNADFEESRPDSPRSTDHENHSNAKADHYFSHDLLRNIRPSAVQGFVCEATGDSFRLMWTPPWNIKHLQYTSIIYEVIYEDRDEISHSGKKVELPAHVAEYTIHVSSTSPVTEYNVWIKAIIDNKLEGPFKFTKCSL